MFLAAYSFIGVGVALGVASVIKDETRYVNPITMAIVAIIWPSVLVAICFHLLFRP